MVMEETIRELENKEESIQLAQLEALSHQDAIQKRLALLKNPVEKERVIEQSEVVKQKLVTLSEQERAIAIAEKSKSQSEAEAIASVAKAEAIKEKEKIFTAQQGEIAEREKQIDLINAARQAEREAISITVAAQADKQAAEDKAESVRILAKAKADAEFLAADAAAKRYQVDAEGKLAIHEANNSLSEKQIAMQVKLATVHELPAIIKESVKPMEQIEGI